MLKFIDDRKPKIDEKDYVDYFNLCNVFKQNTQAIMEFILNMLSFEVKLYDDKIYQMCWKIM